MPVEDSIETSNSSGQVAGSNCSASTMTGLNPTTCQNCVVLLV